MEFLAVLCVEVVLSVEGGRYYSGEGKGLKMIAIALNKVKMGFGSRYLVSDYWSAGCSCVCCYDDAAVVYASHNGSSGAYGFGERDTLGVESEVAVVV